MADFTRRPAPVRPPLLSWMLAFSLALSISSQFAFAQAEKAPSPAQVASDGDASTETASETQSSVISESTAKVAEVIDSAAHMKTPMVGTLKATVARERLKTGISKNQSPFLEGHIQTVPKDTKIDITLTQGINSEFSQKGDEIWARVSCDVPGGVGGHGPIMPGGWMAHGVVTEAQGEKRGNRSGYVSIEFDKIRSPDGEYEVDFKGQLTTKDSTAMMIAKQLGTSSRFISTGALGGALLSVQMTGLGTAVATHGISVGVGAGIGGTLGAIGFLKRKGGADAHYSNDDLQISIDQPIELPVFAPSAFMAAKPVPVMKNMKIAVNSFKFFKDPYGDKHSKLLEVAMTIENHTNHPVSAKQISIVNDFDKHFSPVVDASLSALMKKVQPNASEKITVVYEVDGINHKYWLSLHNVDGTRELSRVPIN
jgi:hypothetical protein